MSKSKKVWEQYRDRAETAEAQVVALTRQLQESQQRQEELKELIEAITYLVKASED